MYWKIVNNVKAVKVTVNGTESHGLVHHEFMISTGASTSRLHSSEKKVCVFGGGGGARLWNSAQPSPRLLSYEPQNQITA